MPESPLVQIETVALNDLEALIATRAKTESDVELGFRKRVEKEETEYRDTARRLAAKYKVDNEAMEADYARAREQVIQTFQRDTHATKDEYASVKKQNDEQLKKEQRKAKKAKEETGWQALAFFEGSRDEGIKWRRGAEADWSAKISEFHLTQETANFVLKRCGKLATAPPQPPATATVEPAVPDATATAAPAAGEAGPSDPSAAAAPSDPAAAPSETAVAAASPEAAGPAGSPEDDPDATPIDKLQKICTFLGDELVALESLRLPKFLRMDVFIWPVLLLGAAVVGGLFTVIGLTPAAIVGGVVAVAAGIGGYLGLAKLARPSVGRHAAALRQALAEGEALVEQSKDWAKNRFETRLKELEKKRETMVRDAETLMARKYAEGQERHAKLTQEADAKYPARLEELRRRHDEGLKQADEKYPPRLKALREKYDSDKKELDASNERTKATTKEQYDQAWANLIKTWTEGMARINGMVTQVRDEGERRFLDWGQPELDGWKPPTEVPPGMRFGAFDVDLNQFPNGIPRDPRLKSVPTHFQLPALLPFPIQGSLLIKAADSGKDEAIALLQAVMLRYLTSVPAGKVRFTIVDPVGLGENFAAFMHLGDYHELLVTNRIWTEAPHIEQRLTDLTEHMENVIQKYLRNEFETIEEYNTMAGEVAEPFRILVVANFPTNFNDAALRRLISIVNSGARCGVYALVLYDTKLGLPSGFQLKELEGPCVNMIWKESRLQWREPNFGRYPLSLDAPPDQARFSQLLHKVGVAARDANRVEVPFEFIAPKPSEFWTFETSKGVDIPLGRAGATKLQHLKLGKGTSQHALTSGKTGSGKSTMLHALITNGALRYSPDQLELYLIDFKKGVEFKVYAAMELPHARVIAVESEREFGLSVLQRLDVELKERGEIYRQLGCQDLAGYREARPEVPLPRILLIIDEFQEFFIEDDKIAQEVSLLLDRLVRQGRAFGMHVILGSQTLGGQYSLPKATLGQMAVRIALQCSEADAHLILSEDNTAARLLTRPGEAIYNDANGMIEGNNLFQVVWLSDERRESYLERIQQMAREQNIQKPPPIVFEGNLPADVTKNPLLNRLLEATEWTEPPRADFAWLGDAIAIKDPTSVVFRPQSGSNVLIVGQNDEAALAMLIMAALSIAAQHPPVGTQAPRFYVLDGSPVDSALAGQLGKLKEILPHPVNAVTWRDLGTAFAGLAEDVKRRQDSASEDQGPIYILIYDVQRFRDLRKSDDDFGYARYDEDKPAPPSKLFSDVLRDGPPVGIHTIVWCDSVNNLNRTLDRQGLKEFENRILFQMSANDSSTLIDNPAASKLGENRALYFSEEENRVEKFRPYGLPDWGWLERVRDRFAARPVPEHTPQAGGNGDGAAPLAASQPPAPAVDEVVDPPVEVL
jgi:DNA segregation ATPase FtsK/SpoIIIE, S-DNA-T family